jgi:hypothetical protein
MAYTIPKLDKLLDETVWKDVITDKNTKKTYYKNITIKEIIFGDLKNIQTNDTKWENDMDNFINYSYNEIIIKLNELLKNSEIKIQNNMNDKFYKMFITLYYTTLGKIENSNQNKKYDDILNDISLELYNVLLVHYKKYIL